MIFAIVGEELGLLGSAFVICSLRRLRVRGLPGRASLPRPVRQAARSRDHGARLRPGGRQPRGGARPRAAHRASRCRSSRTAGRASSACSAPSASSITSPGMGASSPSELACLIAAGGTAGHVRPALAVAEALRDRGVTVTFAGSPDRVEARLVPEAGFPFDAFDVSGFPRRPSLALVRALGQAVAAPFACRRILGAPQAERRPGRRRLRRRADGARGLAAQDPCRADRGGRAPRPRQPAGRAVRAARLPRLRHPGPRGGRYRVVGRPIPRAHLGADRAAARRRAGTARGRAGGRHLRRPRRRAEPERLRGPDVRRPGPGDPAPLRRAGLRAAARCGLAAGLRAASAPSTASATRWRPPISPCPARAAPCGSSPRRARRRSWCPYPARHGRSPDAERAALRARRRGDRRPGREPSPSACRRSSTSCSPTAPRLVAPWARRCGRWPGPQAAEAIAEELISIARA